MEKFTTNYKTIKNIKRNFLHYIEVPIEYNTLERRTITIYRITNKVNGKIYIGKTRNLSNRAGEYVSRFINNKAHLSIEFVMQEYGIENFIMEPIAYAENDERGAELEIYFINHYGTTNHNNGYNKDRNSSSCFHAPRSGDLTQSIETKTRRCKYIVAIDIFKKDIIISTGGMLYGKTIGKGKDIIKNGLVRGSHVQSYFIFYLDKEERDRRLQPLIDRYNNRKYDNHVAINNHMEYLEGYNLTEIISSVDADKINELKTCYNISFIRYADNELGYEIVSVDEFINTFNA